MALVFHKLKVLTYLSIALTALSVHAGTKDGSGGDGVMLGGRPVLLDLIEAGVDENPYFENVAPSPGIRAALEKNLHLPPELKSEVIELLASKITEIDQAAHPAGLILTETMRFYQFRPVKLKLVDVQDDDSVIGQDKVQLAIRKGSVIFLDRELWSELDLKNKVALLIHELVYALQPESNEYLPVLKTSTKVRYLTGVFFQESWQSTWKKTLEKELFLSNGIFDRFYYNGLYKAMRWNISAQNVRVGQLQELDESKSSIRYESIALRSRYSTELKLGALTKNTTPAGMKTICQKLMQGVEPANALIRDWKYTLQSPLLVYTERGTKVSDSLVFNGLGYMNSWVDTNVLEIYFDEMRKCTEYLAKFQKNYF